MPYSSSIKIGGAVPVDLFYKVYRIDGQNQDIQKEQPTLIWLHGGPGFDHSIHEPFISTLAKNGLQVVLIDQRGQGQSGDQDKPEHWNLAQWGNDVYEFCQAKGIKKPIVGGVSFGGVVAQSYMLQHPEHPAGIILCDTDSHVNKDRMLDAFYKKAKATYLAQGNSMEEAEHKASRVKEIATRVFNDPTDNEALQEHFANGIPVCGKNKFDTERPMDCILRMDVAKKYFQNELFDYDFRSQFKEKIKCPVLVMYGDKNAVHSKESAEETIAALPKEYVQSEYFVGAATPVYDNEPERAIECIVEFSTECIAKLSIKSYVAKKI